MSKQILQFEQERVKNPNWWEINQLAIYKAGYCRRPPNTNPSRGRKEDLNSGPPDPERKSSALTIRPCCLQMSQSKTAVLIDKLWNRILRLFFEALVLFVVKLSEGSKSKLNDSRQICFTFSFLFCHPSSSYLPLPFVYSHS